MYNYLFFAIGMICFLGLLDYASGAQLYKKRLFYLYISIFALFTLVFDNLIVHIGIVQYDFVGKTLGIRIPFMPLEDLFYGICLGYAPIILLKGKRAILWRNIQAMLLISRPKLWTNTFFTSIWVLLAYHTHLSFFIILLLLYFLIPYNYLVYGINDFFDRESDLLNERKGNLDGALEQQSFVDMVFTITLLQLPLILYFLIHLSIASIVFALLIVAAITYSAKTFRFKEIPILDSINSSAHFVLPVILTLSVIKVHAFPFLTIGAFFLWGMASQSMGAIQDIQADRSAGIHSIATFFEKKVTTFYSLFCYLSASILLLLQHSIPFVLLGILLLIYPINTGRILFSQNKKMANAVWKQFLLINYGVGFFITQYFLILTLHR